MRREQQFRPKRNEIERKSHNRNREVDIALLSESRWVLSRSLVITRYITESLCLLTHVRARAHAHVYARADSLAWRHPLTRHADATVISEFDRTCYSVSLDPAKRAQFESRLAELRSSRIHLFRSSRASAKSHHEISFEIKRGRWFL